MPLRAGIATWIGRCRATAALLLALVLCALAAAATPPANPMDETLAAARWQMDRIQEQLSEGETQSSLSASRTGALALQAQAADIAAALAPDLANVQARLAGLGNPPAEGGSEPPDVAAQRASLGEQRTQLDAQLRLARLLAVESAQAVEQIDKLRRARFQARLGERTDSILERAFWAELAAAWPGNWQRLQALAQEVGAAATAAPAWHWALAIAVAAALLAGVAALLRWLRMLAATRIAATRLRRSLVALCAALLPPLALLLALHTLRHVMGNGQPLSPALDALLASAVTALAFGAYVAALGRALMSPRRPSWRLPPMPDLLADRMRHDPLLLGALIALGSLMERAAAVANLDLTTEVAVNALVSLVFGLLLARAIRRSSLLRRQALAAGHAAELPPRSLLPLALTVAGWSALALSVGCLLLGYVALGSVVIRQVAWIIIVGATTYLLAVFIDDACNRWLGAATGAQASPGLAQGQADTAAALRRQAAVLLSAAGRVVLALAALSVVFGPLGQTPVELFERAGSLREGIAIGQIRLLPAAVLHALVVLGLGIAAVRLAQRWLLQRYLPTTGLDEGMRSSMATLLGYAGMVVAVALALSALGIGLERVAWIASALSVGIGFGLQAVVQNFVSGLILLTERPVKVGDWVSLGGVEGDIRRINVRATEIQTSDRSTVIVPNSEFITKVVRNVTNQNPLGLVQIRLPMPADTDATLVRALMLGALTENVAVLDAPPPNVLLDSVDDGNLIFLATGSVASPRQAATVRSAVLFDILARLKAHGLRLARQQTLLLRESTTLDDPKETAR